MSKRSKLILSLCTSNNLEEFDTSLKKNDEDVLPSKKQPEDFNPRNDYVKAWLGKNELESEQTSYKKKKMETCDTNRINILSNILISNSNEILENRESFDVSFSTDYRDVKLSVGTSNVRDRNSALRRPPPAYLQNLIPVKRRSYLADVSDYNISNINNQDSSETSEIIPIQSSLIYNPACAYDFSDYNVKNEEEEENEKHIKLTKGEDEEQRKEKHEEDSTDSIISATYDDSDADPLYLPSSNSSEHSYTEDMRIKKDYSTTNDNLEKESEPDVSQQISYKTNDQYAGKNTLVEGVKRKNYKDKLNYCLYCDKDVGHFVRHVLTWHPSEISVQKILSLTPKSKRRREAVASLRKQGNFIRSRGDDLLRPVKRSTHSEDLQTDDFLPCSYCLGFYKRKVLYRHTKRCPENKDFDNRRQTSQSDGQTTLLMGSLMKYDKLLTKELFPRMRADKINLIAKKDLLICQYGYSYMKGRKSKGNLDFVRQNIRRLAKLLEFCKKQKPELKGLIDFLKPVHFSLLLQAVSHIAGYNPETDVYESPTIAMNFGTLLKKCCDLAYIHLIQIENTNDQRKDLKILKKLIESQWADEISAQAALNLNENKWNKTELLPLTSDLKKLSTFLQKSANDAYNQLQLNEKNVRAYNLLKEVVYTQIILLNRRRPAEVAQLKIDKYNAISHMNDDSKNAEFENCLTETEKILLNTYSRIVIRGKRGRGVPILMSPEMKKHFDHIISLRNTFVKDNKYVFHTSGQGFLDGTKILYKYAEKCGADRPKSISATKLRKHLATITQLLHFSDKDLEQLSQFMGHTLKTHCKVYRLSDNMYQTAKVSKLLLLMSEGGIERFKGKNLDDIDVELSPIFEEEDLLNQINFHEDTSQEKSEPSSSTIPSQSVTSTTARKAVIKQSWTIEEKGILANHFSGHIKAKRAPTQAEVSELMHLYPNNFSNRKWTSIKAVVYNMYTGKLKY